MDILSSIFTKHIILPKEKLVSNNNNPGFIMNYINLDTKKDILLATKKELIKEINELEEELILVGKNHFLLSDMQKTNLFYNGNFYLFDPDTLLSKKALIFLDKILKYLFGIL